MFREHVAIGAIVSMIAVTVVYFYALMTDPLLLAILFVVTIIGSFLPDIDSDSGIPFYLVFGSVTLAGTGYVLLYVLRHPPPDAYLVYVIPGTAFLFLWFVVGGVIKRFTVHRGIFHSIPMMCLMGLATMLLSQRYGIGEVSAFIIGCGMAIGFATHLILDELHSAISLDGTPFIPKKSLGTALKLFSDSHLVTITTYVCLATMVYTLVS